MTKPSSPNEAGPSLVLKNWYDANPKREIHKAEAALGAISEKLAKRGEGQHAFSYIEDASRGLTRPAVGSEYQFQGKSMFDIVESLVNPVVKVEVPVELMNLASPTDLKVVLTEVMERRPELVARVQTIISESREFFPDQEVALEDRQFDDWDPLITLVVYAYMPFDAYFAARDRFREWLWEKNWVTDGDLKITEAHAGETR